MNIAAIDIGSNAMRMAVAAIGSDGKPRVLEICREPIRLGEDVFQSGIISETTATSGIAALGRFKQVFEKHQAVRWRAVGTSALREAKNSYEFVAQAAWSTGIQIVPISGDEEARLVSRAVSAVTDLKGLRTMLIDIGGGSVEVSILDDGHMTETETFKMGAVRLRELFNRRDKNEKAFIEMVSEYIHAVKHKLNFVIEKKEVNLAIGAGGNIEALGDLRVSLLKAKNNTKLRAKELSQLVAFLKSRSPAELVEQSNLRPDRADVILPAALVLQFILDETGAGFISIPRVSLRDGMLVEMAEEIAGGETRLQRDQVLRSAHTLGTRFNYDQTHATMVAGFCCQLFDASRSLHGLGPEERMLLEVAALLHDVGQYISLTNHHKHSAYILNASPIVGLGPLQKKIVAQIVRYHHKSFPKMRHEEFASLSESDRARVRKLAALLRLADSIDFSHRGQVKSLSARITGGKFIIGLEGEADLTLDRWALRKHASLFEEVFQMKVLVEEAGSPT